MKTDEESVLDIRENDGHRPTLQDRPSAAKAMDGRGVRLVPIMNDAQRERLKLVSAWDGHPNMLLPTHVLVKGEDNDIVGCTSLGACVFSHTWLHTEKCRRFDMKRAQRDIELVARSVGYRGLALVCPESSPMFKHLTGLGYKDLGDLRVWVKELNGKNGT